MIDSVSQLTGIRLIRPDGTEEELAGEVSKDVLMSGEALDFARYIRDPETYRVAYDADTRLASQVCRTLQEMRRRAGVRFPGGRGSL